MWQEYFVKYREMNICLLTDKKRYHNLLSDKIYLSTRPITPEQATTKQARALLTRRNTSTRRTHINIIIWVLCEYQHLADTLADLCICIRCSNYINRSSGSSREEREDWSPPLHQCCVVSLAPVCADGVECGAKSVGSGCASWCALSRSVTFVVVSRCSTLCIHRYGTLWCCAPWCVVVPREAWLLSLELRCCVVAAELLCCSFQHVLQLKVRCVFLSVHHGQQRRCCVSVFHLMSDLSPSHWLITNEVILKINLENQVIWRHVKSLP